MKSLSWIVGVLLIVATVDALPDPPAVNPGLVVCQVPQLHHCSSDPVAQRSECVGASCPFPASVVAADAYEPCHPTDGKVLTEQAADPSPPVLQDA